MGSCPQCVRDRILHTVCCSRTMNLGLHIAVHARKKSFLRHTVRLSPMGWLTLLMPNQAASRGGFVSTGAAGKVKWNVAPRPSLPVTQIRPPCDSTIDLTDCQAHAAALRLRRKECVEYLVNLAQGQPGPCVMNRNLDLAILTQLRLHRKHAARVLHRLDAIQHEVHQHLLQLHPVRHRHWEDRACKVRADRNAHTLWPRPAAS